MPNYVRNIVIPKDFSAFHDYVKTDKEDISFQKIMPMPDDLIISAQNLWSKDCRFYNIGLKTFQKNQLEPVLKEVYQKDLSQKDFTTKVVKELKGKRLYTATLKRYNWYDRADKEEHLKLMFAEYYNLQKYGAVNWYDWHCNHWGTKWDACESATYGVDYDGYVDTIEFNTAWSTPTGIWEELAKKLDFVVMYADEDYGNNCGVIIAKAGEVDCCRFENDSFFMANTVWSGPMYDYEFEKENGSPVPTDEEAKACEEEYKSYIKYWSKQCQLNE